MISIAFCTLRLTRAELRWLTSQNRTSAHEREITRVFRKANGKLAIEIYQYPPEMILARGRPFDFHPFYDPTPESPTAAVDQYAGDGAEPVREDGPAAGRDPPGISYGAEPGMDAALIESVRRFREPARRSRR